MAPTTTMWHIVENRLVTTQKRGGQNHSEKNIVLDGNNTSLLITGLPYANYTINVTGFNIKTRRPGPSGIQTARSVNIGIEFLTWYCNTLLCIKPCSKFS